MADDLPLPRLAWQPASETFSSNTKRVRGCSPPISSDPALFSSDDDPSVDNYTQERRKKKYRGPWYNQRLASEASGEHDSRRKIKRPFERQFDSGVFMGSDGTDIDEESVDQFERERGSISVPPLQFSAARIVTPLPSAEDLASRLIQQCLEYGTESIDLSYRFLTTISNATIRPLVTFTRVPPVAEGVFSRLDPRLKIFLTSNELTSLPGELFNIDRLTVLSLRGNKLQELPPGIGKLTNLKELNLSQNCLRYLPFEILDLFSDTSRLNTLHMHPNPFFVPQFPPTREAEEVEDVLYKIRLGNRNLTRPRRNAVAAVSPDRRRRSWHTQWKISYQARTEIRYLDINGTLLKGPAFPSNQASEFRQNDIPVADADDCPVPPKSRGNAVSRAPSLLEVALNACSRTSSFPVLSTSILGDVPEHIPEILANAVSKKESGGGKCTICKRNFFIPRTEWIEWWEIAKVLDQGPVQSAASPLRQMENERDVLESMVPLMRRGCSWLCVSEKVDVVGDEDDAMVTDQ